MQTNGMIYVLLIAVVLMGAVIAVQNDQIQSREYTLGFMGWSDGVLIVHQTAEITKDGSFEIIPNIPVEGYDITHYTVTVGR